MIAIQQLTPDKSTLVSELSLILKRPGLCLATLLLCISFCGIALANEPELPVLGDSISGVVSPEKEHRLGRAWLRMLKSQAPLVSDPLLINYVENLAYKLAYNSELEQPDLELVIIDSPTINAFAVPGGIIGINAGLFFNAESEDELSGVIAHELAHLSQRHFARTVEEAKRSQLTNSLALLASIILIASADGDAGLAALATTQAASIQSQLKFSRRNEQEADRVGMRTLVESDMDPGAMSRFFERLQKASEFLGQTPPEYLLTHPVTESRIADARSRASRYPSKNYFDSLEFLLMKARVQVHYTKNLKSFIKLQKSTLTKGNTYTQVASQYAMALAYIELGELSAAQAIIKKLLAQDPDRIIYITTYADIDLKSGNPAQAVSRLKTGLDKTPGNLTLTLYYAEALMKAGAFNEAVTVLRNVSLNRPQDVQIWLYLEKAYGGANDIIGVHQARAEYLFLSNQTEKAIEQMNYALMLIKNDYPRTAKIKGRIEYFQSHAEDLKL